ncbi:DUF2577 domain-containing protein [Psychrobacillus sp. NEAU-3TGS]|uniref:DUF2577 domain-containing protein n=1 Tax=Psychrobacillus sp. NEAU-3TGS TaxID=2995412 RepID=UPI002495DA14|nr:DUF2577 domain-containing protein [Psychrobacillus sp. NEAU-3TGS]MDI2588038.1 DUF2577 domain-containing protein [Psychrobacillus sp. NEAU-3TGS]
MNDILTLFKIAAKEAIEAADPTAIEFGEVTSVAPLKILVEQKKPLTTAQLILTRQVRDHEIEMTVEHSTEESESHTHEYKGKKKFTVHNALKIGDTVLLVKMQGGQKYIVWDKEVDV